MSNIHGLSSNRSEKKAGDEEYSQGAAGQSGTAVWRPNNSAARGPGPAAGAGADDPLAGLLAQARAQSSSGGTEGADRNLGLITLYSNGFIVGSGEFRDRSDPSNRALLEALRRGEVPEEMEDLCRREWGAANLDAVRVQLVDKSSETYTPPKAKFDFAKSQGQALGASSSSAAAGGAAAAAAFSDAVPRRLVVDASQPTTTLQLVLSDRRRVRETANASATVLQVYEHVMSLTGLAGFTLLAGFPPKPLTEPNATLKDAGLLNGSITQRA